MTHKTHNSRRTDCKCAVCNGGMEAYAEWEAKQMREVGWVIHAVVEGTDDPDCHTHGLPELLNHPDLQIKLHGMQEVYLAGQSLHKAVDYIKDGGRFTQGTRYHDLVVSGVTVTVRENEESGRKILQFVIPS